jgi:hypothetical protein
MTKNVKYEFRNPAPAEPEYSEDPEIHLPVQQFRDIVGP